MKITPHSYRYFAGLILLCLISACSSGGQPPLPTWTTAPEFTTPSLESTWLEVYFSDPAAPLAADFEGGPDVRLAEAINSARVSVDMAAYSLTLWSIRDALIHAYQRGVKVRLVMESDNMDSREVQELQEAGISITGDQREGLMHNKFVVIDQNEVWSGSMNYTTSGAYKDNNNLVRIRSSQAAEDYTTEFNEMFTENLFGPETRAVTPHPHLTINGIGVDIYFSPDDRVEAKLLSLLQDARESIHFMAYSFTSNELADAILQKSTEGVSVAGVMDDDQVNSNQGTEYDRFLQAGLDVRRDGNAGQMHHKVIIIDQSIVITGSYNFSRSAEERNDENVVIIHDAAIAEQFYREFQRVYAQAQP